jgi:hypothetical protein
LQMNAGAHGLTAGVYSANEAKARSILRRLDVGTVYVRVPCRAVPCCACVCMAGACACACARRARGATPMAGRYWNKRGIVEPWMPWAGRRCSGAGVFLGVQVL